MVAMLWIAYKPRPEVAAGSPHSMRPEWRSRIDLAISLTVTQCPQWVEKRPRAASELRPFIPQQRTQGERDGMSVWCQERKRDRRYSISLSARSNNAGDRDLEASKVIEPRLVGR
jgi:hypothetical protein